MEHLSGSANKGLVLSSLLGWALFESGGVVNMAAQIEHRLCHKMLMMFGLVGAGLG